MKEVVSLSLGSSKRDFCVTLSVAGQEIRLVRRGVDGQIPRLISLLKAYDGRVAAIGLGGVNFAFRFARLSYPIPLGQRLRALVSQTPVVDGGLYKEFVEPEAVKWLEQEGISFAGKRVLLTSVLDRYPLAQALVQEGARVWAGDPAFGLKLPFALPLSLFGLVTPATMPFLRLVPLSWLYPLGEKQEEMKDPAPHLFARSEIIAGDFHLLRRYLPKQLRDKIIITSTVTGTDVALLRERGARLLVTLSPFFEAPNGRAFGANMMDALLVALSGERSPPAGDDFYRVWRQTGLGFSLIPLN